MSPISLQNLSENDRKRLREEVLSSLSSSEMHHVQEQLSRAQKRAKAISFYSAVEKDFSSEELVQSLEKFVKNHVAAGRRIALVTSGGTTIPLEKNTVRFIDNFSTGNRGATCAEYLLTKSTEPYAVIFLTRKGSAAPFARTIQKLTSPNIDLKFMESLAEIKRDSGSSISVSTKDDKRVAASIHQYTANKERILEIPFESLSEYLVKLKLCTSAVGSYAQSKGFIMFAAAVSDFYIPDHELDTHKIQSKEGPLVIELDQVPKTLGIIRTDFAPSSMCISFKLETDISILIKKAKGSIENYGMHYVVANELHSRYEKCQLVSLENNEFRIDEILKPSEGELEDTLMAQLVDNHSKFMS